MTRSLLASLAAIFCLPAQAAYPDDLRIASWNVMLLPRAAFPNYGQMRRADLIAKAPFLADQDVVAFQEVFDNAAAARLRKRTLARFPHQTPVVGQTRSGWDATEGRWDSSAVTNGGVRIASRYPITRQVQYLFNTAGCGDDQFALKGFAYARIDVAGQPYHLLATHLQSETSWGCDGVGGHGQVRLAQLAEIKAWITAQGIPAHEVVMTSGDLNVNKMDTAHYHDALAALGATEPRYVGMPYTFDTQGNGLALERYGARTGDPVEYLDYVLIDRDHRQPTVWQNLTIDPPSPQWTVQTGGVGRTYAYTDYSDHYPVLAFARADAATPTRSYVPRQGSVRDATLWSQGHERFVQSATTDTGWLRSNAARVEDTQGRAYFNLSNNFAMRDSGCIQSGQYVRIERADRQGYFWRWSSGAGSQYQYQTANGPLNASPELRLINQTRKKGCLRDGDTVAFKDWARASDYYIQAWNGGADNQTLWLWSSRIGPYERYTVRFTPRTDYVDWAAQLIY